MMGSGSTVLSRAAFNIVEGPDGSDLCVNHLSDEELMARCASGDRRAMDILVSRYHGKLLDFAFRHLGNRDSAADIAQTAFVRVFQSAATYRVNASFKTWHDKLARVRGRAQESEFRLITPIP
ncbi:MAG: hypothetical protein GTN93_04205 [Anaerolineae bacterium]|nr:hypothetical protein [Anaerolineae bacterium]